MARSRDEVSKLVVVLNAVVVLVSAIEYLCVWSILEHWNGLMEAAHFHSWPSVRGIVWICIGLGGTYGSSTVIGFFSRRWTLGTLLVATSIALVFALIGLYGVITIGCPDPATAPASTTQGDAIANFNRGVCSTWCLAERESASVASIAMTCGDKPDLAFQSTASRSMDSEVSLWCQQAILQGSFAANATYSGEEPFATLTRDVEVCVPMVWFLFVSVAVAVTVSLCLAAELLIIEALVRQPRSTTTMDGSTLKMEQALVPAEACG